MALEPIAFEFSKEGTAPATETAIITITPPAGVMWWMKSVRYAFYLSASASTGYSAVLAVNRKLPSGMLAPVYRFEGVEEVGREWVQSFSDEDHGWWEVDYDLVRDQGGEVPGLAITSLRPMVVTVEAQGSSSTYRCVLSFLGISTSYTNYGS